MEEKEEMKDVGTTKGDRAGIKRNKKCEYPVTPPRTMVGWV